MVLTNFQTIFAFLPLASFSRRISSLFHDILNSKVGFSLRNTAEIWHPIPTTRLFLVKLTSILKQTFSFNSFVEETTSSLICIFLRGSTESDPRVSS